MKKSELKNLVEVIVFNKEFYESKKREILYTLGALPESEGGSKSITQFTIKLNDFISCRVNLYVSKDDVGILERHIKEEQEKEEKQLRKEKIEMILKDQDLLQELLKRLQEQQPKKKWEG